MAERSNTSAGKSPLSVALTVAAVFMLFCAGYASRHAASIIWSSEKVAGEVVEIVGVKDAEGRLLGYAPSIRYADGQGQQHVFVAPAATYPPTYSLGDRVSVYYDRENASQAALSDFYTFWLWPFLAAAVASLLFLLSRIYASAQPTRIGPPSGQMVAPMLPSAAALQFHPLNPVAFRHYLAHLAQPSGSPKVQITEAAAALAEGRHAVVLAEFLASMCVLAGHDEAARYIDAHLPHLKRARAFGPRGSRGLVFLFEETAFVILPSTMWAGPLRWLRHVTSLRTAGRRYVPAETMWDAAARSRSLARWWESLREEVEAWVGEEALKHDPQRPFVFGGHAIGGGLAILAAYEFRKRGRSVSAVMTFGAPKPGGARFASEYHQLGLDERTDNLVYADRSPLQAQWPFLYQTVGNSWLLERKPLAEREFNDRSQNDGQGIATFVLDALRKDERASAALRRPLRRRLLLTLGALHSRSRAALASHEIARIYALSLDILAYQRLRELIAPAGGAEEMEAAAKALSDHLRYFRGTADAAAQPFARLSGLPLVVVDTADLDRLKAMAPEALV